MVPSAVNEHGVMTNGVNGRVNGMVADGTNGKIDTMNPHDHVHFDPSLKPKKYQIKGTDPNSKVLFRDVNIIDSTGRDPFKGNVYIEGARRVRLTYAVADVEGRRADQIRRRGAQRRNSCKSPKCSDDQRQRKDSDERPGRCTYPL